MLFREAISVQLVDDFIAHMSSYVSTTVSHSIIFQTNTNYFTDRSVHCIISFSHYINKDYVKVVSSRANDN